MTDLTQEGLAARGIRVKPLEWIENPNLGEGGWLGGSHIGPTYHAMDDGWSVHRGMFWHGADTLEAAKAAAQADYEARILDALEVTP